MYLLDTGYCNGPYVVVSLLSVEKCSRRLENGGSVKNGEEIDIDDLVAAQRSSGCSVISFC